MAAQAVGVLSEFAAHLFELAEHEPGVMRYGKPRRRRPHPAGMALQQGHAAIRLHAADALARRGERETGPLGAAGDALRLDDVEEQPQVGQVEAHGAIVGEAASHGKGIASQGLRLSRRLPRATSALSRAVTLRN
ncbi:hypothetical protein GCM10025880_19930 [Methylorubrum aminovorans]|nr:hypothetical protein GCM10025880_19930 [Methylorubrum aminovorans]